MSTLLPFDPLDAAGKIARHAYRYHVVGDAGKPKPLFDKALGIDSPAKLESHILMVMTHPRTRSFRGNNDKHYFYNHHYRTMVVYNPHAAEKGSCYPAVAGLKSFRALLASRQNRNPPLLPVPKPGADTSFAQAFFPANGLYGYYPAAKPHVVRQDVLRAGQPDRLVGGRGRNVRRPKR